MSHRAFALLWKQLEMRPDINNILCELIGQYSLRSALLPDDTDDLLNASLDLLVLLRVIFDLQRTYFQHPRSDLHCSYLLRPDQLLVAILYLLRLKSKVFRRFENISAHYTSKRSFIAQALVSGLRALWLSKPTLSSYHKAQLRDKFYDAWRGDSLNHHDEFLVNALCADMIRELTGPSVPPSGLALSAHKKIQLRDYSAGLYFLEGRTDDFTRPIKDALIHLNRNEDLTWFENYWTLFDITWSTEAALIQLCVHASRPADANEIRPSQDDINQLHGTRTNVLKHIFPSPPETTEPKVQDSIAAVLFTACLGRNCTCLHYLRAQLDSPNTSRPQSFLAEFSRLGRPDSGMDERLLNESLVHLAKVLKNRKEELRDCNGELYNLSKGLEARMDAWCSEERPIEDTESTSHAAPKTIYILPCPNVHPIRYKHLEKLIEHSGGDAGLKELRDNPALLDVNIACEECDNEYPIKKVRQIEPLVWIAAAISEILGRRLFTQHEIQPWATEPEHQPREPSSNPTSIFALPRKSTGSSSISLSEKGTTRTGQLTEFFNPPPKKSNRQQATSYCFSADGNTLVLWDRNEAHVAVYYLHTLEIDKITISNVTAAAAGANLCAIISQDGNSRKLRAYRKGADESIVEINIPTTAYCVAVSRDDRYVAIGLANEARIYSIDSRAEYTHRFNPVALYKSNSVPLYRPNPVAVNMDSQRINFSPQSEQIIVASRYRNGNVYIYIGECTSPIAGSDPHKTIIATGDSKDYGLSSVLYDSSSSCVCVTAFSRSKSPVLLSQQHGFLDISKSDSLGTQIQCAASSPSGQIFTLVNHTNHIFTVQRLANGSHGRWSAERVKVKVDRKAVTKKEELMAVAMPNEKTTHLFWISGAAWTLKTI